MDRQTFINTIAPGAIQAMKDKKILASLSIAQAIQESGDGSSTLSTLANNLFGIKRWGYPNFIAMNTTEYVNGQPTTVQANFRKYGSWGESIADHAQFLIDNSRYANLIGNKDALNCCDLILQDGYATDPNYAAALKALIQQNNLTQYDVVIEVNSSVSALQHSLNRLFNAALKEDGVLGPLTQTAMDNASKILGVSSVADLLTATNQILAFPLDSVPSPHLEYATRYIQYRVGAPITGTFEGITKIHVQNWQATHGLLADGVVGPKSWAQIMK